MAERQQYVLSESSKAPGSKSEHIHEHADGQQSHNHVNEQKEKPHIYCGTCLKDYKYVEAELFCETCKNFLCETCIKVHRDSPGISSHKLSVINTKPRTSDTYMFTRHFDELQIAPAVSVHATEREPEVVEVVERTEDSIKEPGYKKAMHYAESELEHMHMSENTYNELQYKGAEYHSHIGEYLNELEHAGTDSGEIKSLTQSDINVQTSEDKVKCCITGLALLPYGNLLLADFTNKSVKYLQTKYYNIRCHLRLSSGPWDVAVIKENQFVVTVPQTQEIQFVSFHNNILVRSHSLTVSGKCYGIANSGELLIISYTDPGKIEILDIKGNILRRIGKTKHGTDLFCIPEYIAVSPDGASIYVSDRYHHAVVKVTLDGAVVSVYRDQALRTPTGLVVTKEDMLILSSWRDNSVHLVSTDCRLVRRLLQETDGVVSPQAICFCEEDNTLYASSCWIDGEPESMNKIKAFRMKYPV